jgi:hypothetical protein
MLSDFLSALAFQEISACPGTNSIFWLFDGDPVRTYGAFSGTPSVLVAERFVLELVDWLLRKDSKDIMLRTLRAIPSSDVLITKPYRSGRHAAVNPRQDSIIVQSIISESLTEDVSPKAEKPD